jgi:hypothetical protein
VSSLLVLVGLVVIIVALVRTFTKPYRRGHGGAVAELLAEMIVLPFKIAGALLRALGRMWADSRRRRVKLGNDHPLADRLAQGAQRAAARRAARTTREPPPVGGRGDRRADDDPGFDEWWRDTYGGDSPN